MWSHVVERRVLSGFRPDIILRRRELARHFSSAQKVAAYVPDTKKDEDSAVLPTVFNNFTEGNSSSSTAGISSSSTRNSSSIPFVSSSSSSSTTTTGDSTTTTEGSTTTIGGSTTRNSSTDSSSTNSNSSSSSTKDTKENSYISSDKIKEEWAKTKKEESIFSRITSNPNFTAALFGSQVCGFFVSVIMFYYMYRANWSIKKAEILFIDWVRTWPLYPPPGPTKGEINSRVDAYRLQPKTRTVLSEWFVEKDLRLEKGINKDEVLTLLCDELQLARDTDQVCKRWIRGVGDKSEEKCRLMGVTLQDFLTFVVLLLEDIEKVSNRQFGEVEKEVQTKMEEILNREKPQIGPAFSFASAGFLTNDMLGKDSSARLLTNDMGANSNSSSIGGMSNVGNRGTTLTSTTGISDRESLVMERDRVREVIQDLEHKRNISDNGLNRQQLHKYTYAKRELNSIEKELENLGG